jgi:hypothetical protein
MRSRRATRASARSVLISTTGTPVSLGLRDLEASGDKVVQSNWPMRRLQTSLGRTPLLARMRTMKARLATDDCSGRLSGK